ncbi:MULTISPECIES: response regulator transcription factor [unclassified Roseovarius]|uniref:response regulator transcription factor n=2 Tax=Roseovarius TaxID=74030 RepID=UPI00273E89BB|nr:response regulator transcription factor [Roseovarius sp. MMSF_3350]
MNGQRRMNRILLADDHALVLETIAYFLTRQAGFQVERATSLSEALKVNAEKGPFNLIVLDYTMPGMDALTGLTRMRAQSGCPVAILSGTAPPDIARRALRAGAAGFLPKTLTPEQLVQAIGSMLDGETYLPVNFLTEPPPGATATHLTPREQMVLHGVAEGKLNREIARDLDIQEVTVKLHVKTLSRKLGARNRTHAAMLARDMSLV